MKASKLSSRLSLLIIPLIFSGCYTQFPAYERSSPEHDRYSDYYAWDGFEDGRENPDAVRSYSYDEYRNSQARQGYNANYYDEDYAALEEDGIYYKDYETENWYKDNYADNVYWKGYEDGYGNGFEDGFDNAAKRYASRSYYYGYKPWAYSSWHRNNNRLFRRHYIYGAGFSTYFAFYNTNWGFDIYNPSGYWYYDHTGFLRYWYNPYGFDFYSPFGYYGYTGFYGNPYYNTLVYYNNYTKTNRYRRSAELYRKGPRNSGLVNRDSYRSRSSRSNYTPRTRGSSVRSRSINSGSRVRSTGRSSSVGRSSGNVGRSRGTSSSGSSRSRGSGSSINRSNSGNNGSSGTSVGRSRSNNRSGSSVTRSRNSSGDSSSRSRGSGSLSSNDNRYSIDRNSSGTVNRSVYSVPVKRVDRSSRVNISRSSFLNNQNAFRSVDNSTRSSFRENFRNKIIREQQGQSRNIRSIRSAINRSSSNNRSIRSSSRSNSGSSKVTRSKSRSSSKGSSRNSSRTRSSGGD